MVHGKILIISGHFFVIPKYVILIINELMVGKREITEIFSKLKQIISFCLWYHMSLSKDVITLL